MCVFVLCVVCLTVFVNCLAERIRNVFEVYVFYFVVECYGCV